MPTIFGMNFQAVSVGQKLIEKSLTPTVTGGYLDAQGTPTPSLLSEIEFVDASIGKMVAALKSNGVYDSTLIVISAKHGQSPVDSSRYVPITTSGLVTTSPATILAGAGCIPFSESPLNPTGIGPTEDDVSLVWLNSSCTTADAVSLLESQSPATGNIAGIGQIFWGPGIAQLFNPPGLAAEAGSAHAGHSGYAQYRRYLLRQHEETGRAWRFLARRHQRDDVVVESGLPSHDGDHARWKRCRSLPPSCRLWGSIRMLCRPCNRKAPRRFLALSRPSSDGSCPQQRARLRCRALLIRLQHGWNFRRRLRHFFVVTRQNGIPISVSAFGFPSVKYNRTSFRSGHSHLIQPGRIGAAVIDSFPLRGRQ